MIRSCKTETNDMVYKSDKKNIAETDVNEISQNQCVACMSNNDWWVGIVENLSEGEDIFITFMHLHGPQPSFK